MYIEYAHCTNVLCDKNDWILIEFPFNEYNTRWMQFVSAEYSLIFISTSTILIARKAYLELCCVSLWTWQIWESYHHDMGWHKLLREDPASVHKSGKRPRGSSWKCKKEWKGLTAQRYIDEVLRPVVSPYVAAQPGMILQQDNARPHIARITQQYLQQNNVDVLPWPASSPDKNPIEHLWDRLGRKICARRLGDVQQLRAAIQQEWDAVGIRAIRTLVTSMRLRCTALVNANGGHTAY